MSTMNLRIGIVKSSRRPDIDALFQSHYPQVTCCPVDSHLTLGEVDVVLAGGGPDFTPALYGQQSRDSRGINPERDFRELEIVQTVLERGIPFLGLCRGAQLLNVALGGTLFQDLETERGQGHAEIHQVTFSGVGESHLGKTARVNSSHHQGVDHLGQGLQVIGTADDGLPEAWFKPGAIGVQFHPETLIKEDLHWLRLFNWWLDGAA